MKKLNKIIHYNEATGEEITLEMITSMQKEDFKSEMTKVLYKIEHDPFSMTLEELEFYRKNIRHKKSKKIKYKLKVGEFLTLIRKDDTLNSLNLLTRGLLYTVSHFMNKSGILIYGNHKPIPSFQKLQDKISVTRKQWDKIKKDIHKYNIIVKRKDKNNRNILIVNPAYANLENFIITEEVYTSFKDDMLSQINFVKGNISEDSFKFMKDDLKKVLNTVEYQLLDFKFNPNKYYTIIDNVLKERGIYFLYNDEEIVYIGKSTNIYKRIQQHKKDKVFTSVTSIIFKDEGLINLYEPYLIQKYKPKLNRDLLEDIKTTILPEIKLEEE